MQVELPLGDVVDRIAILRLKAARLGDPVQRANVGRELDALDRAWVAAGHPPVERLDAWDELLDVNQRLWDVEDALREHERRGDFGPDFVRRARSVYQLNDRRAALKRAVSVELGSRLVEEKSYSSSGSE